MNLNISNQETSPKEHFDKIVFTCENFEEMHVDASYIENLDLYTNSFGKDYESVIIIFNGAFEKECPEILKRMKDRKDIIYVDLVCIEGADIELSVPYEEDENGFNKLQNIGKFEGGEIMLEIAKNGGLVA